ncbi:hypothetical protein AVEN_190312-1 [Araneus ventricosus]|uniref:Uncharacterized protein n=1 Tax=Araneus ventricosus TaxID=182803 RepID=A0A4Y2TI43_ARAVE|nr:hypothetical protein AVEN_190312-1 [Araneus ventricosus]
MLRFIQLNVLHNDFLRSHCTSRLPPSRVLKNPCTVSSIEELPSSIFPTSHQLHVIKEKGRGYRGTQELFCHNSYFALYFIEWSSSGSRVLESQNIA